MEHLNWLPDVPACNDPEVVEWCNAIVTFMNLDF